MPKPFPRNVVTHLEPGLSDQLRLEDVLKKTLVEGAPLSSAFNDSDDDRTEFLPHLRQELGMLANTSPQLGPYRTLICIISIFDVMRRSGAISG